MTNDEVMQMEEAKLVAEQEAKEAVSIDRRRGETRKTVLKETYDAAYKEALERELGVQ